MGDYMILRMPAYCRDFRCSADKCGDNCCIGWEIDIDEKTSDYYLSAEGDFGDRLRENIQQGSPCSFVLKDERCPFLNENNLCDIILNLGEDKLCHICDNHPRYYEWFDGITEGGVGLCCEEAARLILEKGDDEGFWDREVPDEDCDSYDEGLYNFLFSAREKITAYLRDNSIPLRNAVSSVLYYSEVVQSLADNMATGEAPEIEEYTYPTVNADKGALLEIFRNLEPIDEKWIPYINELESGGKSVSLTARQEQYVRNIGVYFIWRYFMKGVFDEEILSKVRLAVISMVMVSLMFSAESEADEERCAVLAKNYSKEIEYSEENLEAVYDMTYTEAVFSPESLSSFFE